MWIVILLIALTLALVMWRVLVVVRKGQPSRPIDSGHPHLTDVDPHPPDSQSS